MSSNLKDLNIIQNMKSHCPYCGEGFELVDEVLDHMTSQHEKILPLFNYCCKDLEDDSK